MIKADDLPEEYIDNMHAYVQRILNILPLESSQQIIFSGNVLSHAVVSFVMGSSNPIETFSIMWNLMKTNIEEYLNDEK